MKRVLQMNRATLHRWSPLITQELSLTIHTPDMSDEDIDATMPILRELKKGEYINAIIYPYVDGVSEVVQLDAETKSGKYSASQITRFKIRELWIAEGSKGDCEEHYQGMQKRIQAYIDSLIQKATLQEAE